MPSLLVKFSSGAFTALDIIATARTEVDGCERGMSVVSLYYITIHMLREVSPRAFDVRHSDSPRNSGRS
jgi:hypothetical protein